jgi:hypothetical protein
VSAVPGQDVIIVNGVNFTSTLSRILSLEQANMRLAADVSSLKAEVGVFFQTSTSHTLATTTKTMAPSATTSPQISTCLLHQSPQNLTRIFQSFSSFVSAGGEHFMIAEQRNQSVLFRYTGDPTIGFVSQQMLWSPSATIYDKTQTFKVGSTQYVALPFYSDGITLNYRCELFTFNETTGLLTSAQNISTMSVVGVSAITTPTGITYLALSNFYGLTGSTNIPSYIMRYNNSTKLFQHFRNITTQGAYPPEWFQFGSDIFLAIPNLYDNGEWLQNSIIYKLDAESNEFSLNQTIPTNGGTHLKPWTRNSQLYVSVVHSHGGYIDTFIFNSTLSQFVNMTGGSRLYSSNPNGVDVIDIAGHSYMAVAPQGSVFYARIYKWNDALTCFEQTQTFIVSASGWYYPHFFTYDADAYLALADSIYKFCSGQFVLS